MKTSAFLSLLLIAILLSSCDKTAGPLPPLPPPDPIDTIITPIDTINHIIGFGQASMKFNGEIWPSQIHVTAYKNWPDHFYIISDTAKNAINKTFALTGILCKIGKGTIENDEGYDDLLNGIPGGLFTVFFEGDQPVARYVTDSTRIDNFFEIIRYDSIKQIVEGRFSTFLVNEYNGTHNFPFITVPDTISITEGKFHLKIEQP